MWQKIKQLNEEIAALEAEGRALLQKGETEKRDLTGDESKAFDGIAAKIAAKRAELQRYQSLSIQNAAAATFMIGNDPKDEARQAFNEFCRTGEIRATNTITTSTAGGAFVPKQVLALESVAKLGNSLKACHLYYGIPAIEVSGKVSFSAPVIDMDDGDELAGDADGESQASGTPGSVVLNVTTHNSKAQWMDNGVVTAQSYDAAGSLVPVLRVACERGEEAAWYDASITTAGNKAAALETAAASKVTYADMSALLFSLGAYALGRTAYLVSMSLLAAMHSMTDDQGRPLGKLTKDGSGQYFWDGVPVFPTTELEAIADGKYVAAVINADACRVAASQPWVNRYDQTAGRPNQTGYDYLEYAAFGVKSGAVKLLKVKTAQAG